MDKSTTELIDSKKRVIRHNYKFLARKPHMQMCIELG